MEPRQTNSSASFGPAQDKSLTIKSHAELEQYHYQALRQSSRQALLNPYYLAEGLADAVREDLMMNMPVLSQVEIPVEQVIIHRYSDMSKQEYDLLQQMALRVKHLEKKLAEFQTKKKPRGKY